MYIVHKIVSYFYILFYLNFLHHHTTIHNTRKFYQPDSSSRDTLLSLFSPLLLLFLPLLVLLLEEEEDDTPWISEIAFCNNLPVPPGLLGLHHHTNTRVTNHHTTHYNYTNSITQHIIVPTHLSFFGASCTTLDTPTDSIPSSSSSLIVSAWRRLMRLLKS